MAKATVKSETQTEQKEVKNASIGSPRKKPRKATKPASQEETSTATNTTNALTKQCHCRLSKCLKLYCECFTMGQSCVDCDCVDCHNKEDKREERDVAVKQILSKNPQAFFLKSNPGMRIRNASERQTTNNSKGCNCRRSGCRKKYCECYQARVRCTELCGCLDCKNMKQLSKSSNILHLIDPFGHKPPASIGSVLKRKEISRDFIPSEKRETGIVKFSRTLPMARHRFVESEHFRQTLGELLDDATLTNIAENLFSVARHEEDNFIQKSRLYGKSKSSNANLSHLIFETHHHQEEKEEVEVVRDEEGDEVAREGDKGGEEESEEEERESKEGKGKQSMINKRIADDSRKDNQNGGPLKDNLLDESIEEFTCFEVVDLHRNKDLTSQNVSSTIAKVNDPELTVRLETMLISCLNARLSTLTETSDDRVQMLKMQSTTINYKDIMHKQEASFSQNVQMTPVKRIMYSHGQSHPSVVFPSQNAMEESEGNGFYSSNDPIIPYSPQRMNYGQHYAMYNQSQGGPTQYSHYGAQMSSTMPVHSSGVSAQDVDILSHFIHRNQQQQR